MSEFLTLARTSRRPRVLDGHPWLFAGEVESPLPSRFDGSAVELKSKTGKSLGTGIYNSRSKIIWRRFGAAGMSWNREYFEAAIDRALARRNDEPVRRIVWSEADQLPGLVVDQYNHILVIQCLTAAADAQQEEIAMVLNQRLAPREIVFRNDAPSRRHEGLDSKVFTQSGDNLHPDWYEIEGFQYLLDLQNGQKTGFYLDQRKEHIRVGRMASGRRVLDAFCNQGAFALHCARSGSLEVIGLDISDEAIFAARDNAQKNQVEARFTQANVFDWFGKNRRERFDLIILDPPSFAPNRKATVGALRGYKELHLRALRMLNPGGILATYSCSQHISREAFIDNLSSAALDAGKSARILASTSQPFDHPILLGFPESEYLKGLIVQVD